MNSHYFLYRDNSLQKNQVHIQKEEIYSEPNISFVKILLQIICKLESAAFYEFAW